MGRRESLRIDRMIERAWERCCSYTVCHKFQLDGPISRVQIAWAGENLVGVDKGAITRKEVETYKLSGVNPTIYKSLAIFLNLTLSR